MKSASTFLLLTVPSITAFQFTRTPHHLSTFAVKSSPLGPNIGIRNAFSQVLSLQVDDENDDVQLLSKNVDQDDKNICPYCDNPYYLDGTKPNSAFLLATQNFLRQGSALLEQIVVDKLGIVGKSYIPPEEKPPLVFGFTLSNEQVKEAERKRESRPEFRVESNFVARGLYEIGCFALDELFVDRPIARFWFLEIIARIPYFSYVSMLHLYESFGWWRGIELRKIHNAEEYNELHHLLIMEALGGNSMWSDRFLGYHVAIVYYWALNALFFFSPRAAYSFMELLEAHAVDTYGTFLKENKTKLKSLPPPAIARSYYTSADLYLFDDFQVGKEVGTRRPPCDNLYDVFKNICEDEMEHVKTMAACQDYARVGKLVVSPHLADVIAKENDQERRQLWNDWVDKINEESKNSN